MKAKSGRALFFSAVFHFTTSMCLSVAANATETWMQTDGSLGSAQMISPQSGIDTIEENLGVSMGGACRLSFSTNWPGILGCFAQRELLAQPADRHPAYWAPFILIGSWL